MKKYKVKFYARLRDEIIERIFEVSAKEDIEFALKYYGSNMDDVKEIILLTA